VRVCLICIEMFGRGTHGGFGRATRIIGRELVARDVEVTAVVPQRSPGFPSEYAIAGMRVLQYGNASWRSPMALYREVDADVYHSQDPSFGSYLAMKAMPDRAHVITFRDPMDRRDRRIEWRHAGSDRLGWLKYSTFVDNFLVGRAVRRATGLYCAANFLIPKVHAKYGLDTAPRFLPTPVDVPDRIAKSATPVVCFVGRWHRRKRPELFLQLARRFPDVRFVAVGGTRDETRDRRLRQEFADVPNLEMTGVIDQFETDRLNQIYSASWILINTAAREGLPNTFLEAAAHRCAILSVVDPDRFASRFGHHASEDGLAEGLAHLLKNDRWQRRGELGYEYVSSCFETNKAMVAHLDAYRQALSSQRDPSD
jgi:glycosyltransferase involved in cell wall biosynthesis